MTEKQEWTELEHHQTENTDFVIVSFGVLGNWLQKNLSNMGDAKVGLANLTDLEPFPGHALSKILQGKTKVLVVCLHSYREREYLIDAIRSTLDKAQANALYGEKELLFPDYAVYQENECPILYECYIHALPDLEEFIPVLKNIVEEGKEKVFHLHGKNKFEEKEQANGRSVLYYCSEILRGKKNIADVCEQAQVGHFAICGMPLDNNFYFRMATEEIDSEIIPTMVDHLVSPDPKNWLNALDKVKEGGSLVIQGSHQEPEKWWAKLDEQLRTTIIEKKLKILVIDGYPTTAMFPSDKDILWQEAVFIGAALKAGVFHTDNEQGVDKLDKILEGSWNESQKKAIRFGYDNLVEIDYDKIGSIKSSHHVHFAIKEAPPIADSKDSPQEKLVKLFSFHLGFIQDTGILHPYEGMKFAPALMAPYRNLQDIRYDYPLCLFDREENPIVPLSNLINKAAEVHSGDMDQKTLRYHLRKLESYIKGNLPRAKAIELPVIWKQCAEKVCNEIEREAEKNLFIKEVEFLEKELNLQGLIIDCNQGTPGYVLHTLWKQRLADIDKLCNDRLRPLISKLKQIMETDNAKGGDSYTPEKLEKSMGYSDDIDFNELSKILTSNAAKTLLNPERRKRVQYLLKKLEIFQDFFNGKNGEKFMSTYDGITSLRELVETAGPLRMLFLELIKALQIAVLETESLYKEERYGAFFERFGWQNVNPEALELCPPLVFSLRSSDLHDSDQNTLMELLSWKLPVKVMLLVDDLFLHPTSWVRKIGEMAVSMENVFVGQSACNNLPHFIPALQEALAYPGPALLHIYTGDHSGADMLPYLTSAAAHESRAFPAFTYNPQKGITWAERFSISENNQANQDWPISSIDYQNLENQEQTMESAFTYADFLALDRRFAGNFQWAPKNTWHEQMIPLYQYLELPSQEAENKIPYIMMVNTDNTLHRVIVNKEIVEQTVKQRDSWRRIRELGGIDNSHAKNALAEEQQRLEEQKQAEVKQIEQKHHQEMEKSLDHVTEEIVDKISCGLLGLASGATAPLPMSAKTETKAKEDKEPEVEKEEQPAVEEEILEEAYIDTMRCTTCNECINVNKQMFAYNDNKQAYIKDPKAGTFRQLVEAAEKCPAKIIHPGQPLNSNEEGLEELLKRAEVFE